MLDQENWGANARIAAILLTLLTKGQVSKVKLRDQYAKSDRTIERDIATVVEIFKKVLQLDVKRTSTAAGPVYRLQNDSVPFLNKQDVLILSTLLITSRSFNPADTKKLLAKLAAQMNLLAPAGKHSGLDSIITREQSRLVPIINPHQMDFIGGLAKAIQQKKEVALDYTTAFGYSLRDYLFSPTRITYYNHYWYVDGFDHSQPKRGQVRYPKSLRISRIQKLTITNKQNLAIKQEIIEAAKGPNKPHDDTVGVYKGNSIASDTIVLKTDYEVTELAVDQLNATINGYYDDRGRVITVDHLANVPKGAPVQISTRLIEGAGSYIILGLDGVEVIAPADVRNEIKEKLARSLAKYQN